MIVEIILGYWFALWFVFCVGFVLTASVVFCVGLLLLFVVKRVRIVLKGGKR